MEVGARWGWEAVGVGVRVEGGGCVISLLVDISSRVNHKRITSGLKTNCNLSAIYSVCTIQVMNMYIVEELTDRFKHLKTI